MRVGANAVVIKSVPENATVVCAEPRVIVRDEKLDNTFNPYLEIRQ